MSYVYPMKFCSAETLQGISLGSYFESYLNINGRPQSHSDNREIISPISQGRPQGPTL